jgi:U3 small nucleolar RNA-associated protein 14
MNNSDSVPSLSSAVDSRDERGKEFTIVQCKDPIASFSNDANSDEGKWESDIDDEEEDEGDEGGEQETGCRAKDLAMLSCPEESRCTLSCGLLEVDDTDGFNSEVANREGRRREKATRAG